jgi:O-antigen/teichoic acid export membrane protein
MIAVDVLDTPAAGPAAIRGTVLRVGGYVTGVGLTFASAALLVRHLGVEDFGRYVTVTSIVLLAGGLTDAGLTSVGVREFATRTGAERDRVMRSLVGLRIALTLVAWAGATGFAWIAGYESELVLGTFIAGGSLVGLMAQNSYSVGLMAELRLGWVTGVELLRQAGTAALIVALVIADADLLPFLAVAVVANLVAMAATAWLVRRSMPLLPSVDPRAWFELLRETLPFAAATAVSVAYFRVTIVLMSLMATATQTGYFATSYRILEALVFVPNLVISSVFPILARAARDDAHRLRYAAGRIFEVAAIVGVWIAVVIGVGAPLAIRLIAGDLSDPSIDLLRIQGVAIVATFIAVAAQFTLLSLRRHRTILAANGFALVASIVLNVILISAYEALGAAIATTVAELLLAATAAALLARAEPELRLWTATLPKVLLAAGAALAAALLPGFGEIVGAIVATVVYFGTLAVLRAIPDELRQELPRMRNS